MKRVVTFCLMLLVCGFSSVVRASDGYNTQKGAVIGALGGALAGQAIGRNTAGTLIGAASGALIGAVAGNAMDQNRTDTRLAQVSRPMNAPPPPSDQPPGEWVEVPGQWVNGQWVPPHRTWVPVNPGGAGAAVAVPQGAFPPAYVIETPPTVVPIPGSYVYYVPDIGVDIFFYHGYWYRPYGGHWYRGAGYNGPWVYVGARAVPPPIIGIPPDYRRVMPPGYRPVPYIELQGNWRRWERERHWDHHR
ncbi:MAG TPA: glycine zipper family protein [Syntrophorhabdaceae bacterium]|nr:glycine zipper family protein [Syntrophorhabdaceae bacterium]